MSAKGQVLGGSDLVIAAQAIALDFTLMTSSKREFARVKDLRCEDWVELS